MNTNKAVRTRARTRAQELFWRKQLEKLPVLNLHTDYSRPPVQSSIRAREFIHFDTNVYSTIKELCLHEDVSPFTTVLAAYKIILLRYTGQQDIVVGSVYMDTREGADRQEFANPIALRTRLADSLSAREALRRVARTIEEAYAPARPRSARTTGSPSS